MAVPKRWDRMLTIQPNSQRRILRILPRLKEPEESVNRIVLRLMRLVHRVRREVDISRVRMHARRGLTNAGLLVRDGDAVVEYGS